MLIWINQSWGFMMKKLLAVALATVMTQQAMAVNWYLLGENTAGNKVYIDLDSIQADTLVNGTPVMAAWMQVEYKQVQDLGGGKKYWSGKYFDYFDCHSRKSATEFIITYDKQGRVVSSVNNPSFSRYSSANWYRVAPDTAGETKLDTVCLFAN